MKKETFVVPLFQNCAFESCVANRSAGQVRHVKLSLATVTLISTEFPHDYFKICNNVTFQLSPLCLYMGCCKVTLSLDLNGMRKAVQFPGT